MLSSDKVSRLGPAGELTPRSRPSKLALGSGEVHLWSAELDLERKEVERLAGILSQEELARARELRLDTQRSRFIASRAFLRETLAGYLGTEPAELRFASGPQGKPELDKEEGSLDLRFNLSHSESLGLLAVTLGLEVGVDLERIGLAERAGEIAERFFSASERAYLDTLPEAERAEAFYTSWTMKEAFLKATGSGLAGGLEDLAVTFEDGTPKLKRMKGDKLEAVHGWHVQSLTPHPGYLAALAVSERPSRVLTFR